ncbi:MAG: shikimate kinase [Pseudomonadota bacterium]
MAETRWVSLVGMMGAGKSAIGQSLAHRLGLRSVDSDVEIETAAAMTIPEIFDRFGEDFFREKESLVLERLLGGPPGVLSTGGGAVLSATNRALLRDHSIMVWLDCDLETLWQRVRQKTDRPLLLVEDPKGTLATLIEARAPLYAEADVRVYTGGSTTVPQIVDDIITALPFGPAHDRSGS